MSRAIYKDAKIEQIMTTICSYKSSNLYKYASMYRVESKIHYICTYASPWSKLYTCIFHSMLLICLFLHSTSSICVLTASLFFWTNFELYAGILVLYLYGYLWDISLITMTECKFDYFFNVNTEPTFVKIFIMNRVCSQACIPHVCLYSQRFD